MPARHHLNIESLHLDLHGIDPATAQAAVQLLGPALAAALSGIPGQPREHLDAGTLRSNGNPQQLATAIAQHLAGTIGGQQP